MSAKLFSEQVFAVCSFVRTGGGYEPLEYGIGHHATALQDSQCSDLQAVTGTRAAQHPYQHHHSSGSVKPGKCLLPMQHSVLSDFALLGMLPASSKLLMKYEYHERHEQPAVYYARADLHLQCCSCDALSRSLLILCACSSTHVSLARLSVLPTDSCCLPTLHHQQLSCHLHHLAMAPVQFMLGFHSPEHSVPSLWSQPTEMEWIHIIQQGVYLLFAQAVALGLCLPTYAHQFPTCATSFLLMPLVNHVHDRAQPPCHDLYTHTGAWAPSVVVELVTRFARRLSQDVAWPKIEELLVLINQVRA